MKDLLLLCVLMAGMGSATAQTTYTKWKQVQDPSTLQTDDVVVIVDLTTANAMRNNPEYEGENTVSKAAPPALKVTLKEEQDRITSEVADTLLWTADRTDGKYVFTSLYDKNKGNTRYLFNSDQNLRVGYVSKNDAWKRKFDMDKGLLFMDDVEVGEEQYKDYHAGLKTASGIAAMMSGSTWELAADSVDANNASITYVNKDIAATKMAFFKKVETTLPDPTIHFPGHDYEADLKGSFTAPVAVVDEDASAAITYWSSNENVATVDKNTGAVTPKKRGTVRIYAQVAETATYDNCLTSYVLRIDDTTNDVKGCRTNPFTVAEAIAYAKAEGHEEETANGVCYFVKGIVSSVGGAMAGMEGMEDMMEMMSGMMEGMDTSGFDMSSMLSMFMGEQEAGTVTYAITDNGVNRDSLSVNNGRGMLLENRLVDITEDSLSVGDWVTVYGPLDYSEDSGMMAMFGGNKEKTVKMPRVNYMDYHKRNLITEDIILYYEQEKKPEELFSITDLFGGTLVTKDNAGDATKPYTVLTPSDKEIADWVMTSETDSVLRPKKEGIITIKVKAPVMLNATDTVYMERRFTVDVRDRELPAAGTMVGNYELVTSTTELQAGDKLIVVATIDDKPKVLVKSSGSGGGMMAMFGGSSNAKDVTIGDDGKIAEIPDITRILTLEKDGDKWLLQTGKTADYTMTYLYVSDTDGGSNSMIPGMGSSGATLKTGTRAAVGDSCQVTLTFPAAKNDSVQIQFNFQDREKDGKAVTAKNVIRYEKGMMSTSFGGFEPESDKATLPRLYRLVQADEYQVTISKALWATIISSYDVTLPAEVKGYAVADVTDKNVQLSEVLTTLKGGEPYLLHSEAAGTYTLTKATEAVSAPATNLLQISDNNTADGVYVLANGADGAGFYRWMGGKLGAGRVYLPVSSSASKFLPFGDGETTSLREEVKVNSEKPAADAAWYTLDGRRLNGRPAQKGIYIYNGKKLTQ